MCGITGGWWATAPKNLDEKFRSSLNKLKNRGPNDLGSQCYRDSRGTVVLGHTRLSIIDLTAAGHQPMLSKDQRFSIVFNGEIYNYRELRKELATLGHSFSSDSDTEVLLAAWQEWDVGSLERLEGMFAFVVYDTIRNTLSCVRDAFGIKPLFYDIQQHRFLFSSEQAALLSLREEKSKANWQRCHDYLVHSDYDSQQHTFIDGVEHLLPGHWLEVHLPNPSVSRQQCWWRPELRPPSDLTFTQAAEAIREQFLHNIRLHLRSDVPLGAALSGGVDSSAVVCAMRHVQPDMPINTFTFVADNFAKSEERWADQINHFTGAHEHKISATGEDLARDLDNLIKAQGEPFGSTAIYAHYRVCQLTRDRGVTVTLEGHGGDELLAGYTGYPGYRLLSLLEQGNLLEAQRFTRNWARWPDRQYVHVWQQLAAAALPDPMYRIARRTSGRTTPTWLNVDIMAEAGVRPLLGRTVKAKMGKGRRVTEHLISTLQSQNLPSMLRHSDRSSMHFSIESRVPFLTLPLANLLLSMPEHYLISVNGETKSVFRAAMRGIVPDEALNRRDKIGFSTPEKVWLFEIAHKVRDWLQASERIPFLDRRALLDSFDSVVAGRTPFTWQIWRWINFIRWYETFELE